MTKGVCPVSGTLRAPTGSWPKQEVACTLCCHKSSPMSNDYTPPTLTHSHSLTHKEELVHSALKKAPPREMTTPPPHSHTHSHTHTSTHTHTHTHTLTHT